MTPDEELRRAEEARSIIGRPVFKEAYAMIEERLVNELAKADIDPKRAEYVRTLLVAHRKVRGYLEQVMQTGQMVELMQAQEEQRRSQLGRLMDVARGRA